MATPSRASTPGLRELMPGDEANLELFLARLWTSSVTLRANATAFGLENQGQPFQGTYYAAWEGATIVGLAAHYNTGALILQAPRSLAQVVRGAVGISGRPVTAIQGPWPQVEGAVAALALTRGSLKGKPLVLSTIDFAKITAPDVVRRKAAKLREATLADIDALVPWYVAYHGEFSGLVDSPEARDYARADVQRLIEAHSIFVAETERLAAMACFEVWQQDAVRIGGIYTPPALKDKGFDAAAVYAALQAAQILGAKRAVALCDKANAAAQKSQRAVGFVPLSDYGTLRVAS